jgi:hypothetical protein
LNREFTASPARLIQEIINKLQEVDKSNFTIGHYMFYLKEMGYSNRDIANDIGHSQELVRVLIQTFEAFPTEESRIYADKKHYYYRIAATTDNPHYWMEQAIDNGWSTREFQKAVQKNPIPDEYREIERILYRVSAILNQRDELSNNLFRGLSNILNLCALENTDVSETAIQEKEN